MPRMEWWLAVLGFIMSLLATADLAHKYGSALIKKISEKRSRADCYGTSLAVPKVIQTLA
jgi:hypothetical protein